MKSKHRGRPSVAAGRLTPVPAKDLAQFKKAVTERVVQPMKERAVNQRENVARARARYVR